MSKQECESIQEKIMIGLDDFPELVEELCEVVVNYYHANKKD